MAVQEQNEPKKSVFRLIADIPGLLTQLIRNEIEQLKLELSQKLVSAAAGIGLFAAAATVAGVALLALVAAAILGLTLVVPAWASALIVAGFLLVVTLILALIGRSLLKRGTPPTPTKTLRSLQKDVDAIKGIGKRE
jgi:Putative Actinobacterial Holin-X, holin superfamily III